MAVATHTSGLARYTLSAFVPLLLGKLRLNERTETECIIDKNRKSVYESGIQDTGKAGQDQWI